MLCAQTVFRCFKWLERLGDKITGAAGPVFVFLAVVLLSLGLVCFFDVVAPSLPIPWLSVPICILIATNLFVHYFYVCTISPGFVSDPPHTPGTSWLWAGKRTTPRRRELTGVQWSDEVNVTRATTSKCRRCGEMRPERSHHCRICNRCVLKYDHHCPWINQCVGLHNERHFVMFLAYLSLASLCFAISGWQHVMQALGWLDNDWPYMLPAISFLLVYILATVLGFAVTVMGLWHVWSVASGETSVEGQDHEHYRRIAKGRGEDFTNSYDLGRRKNLQLFFNIGKDGYPLYTLFLPLRVPPYTDGRSWARKQGLERHRGVRVGDELTDEDD